MYKISHVSILCVMIVIVFYSTVFFHWWMQRYYLLLKHANNSIRFPRKFVFLRIKFYLCRRKAALAIRKQAFIALVCIFFAAESYKRKRTWWKSIEEDCLLAFSLSIKLEKVTISMSIKPTSCGIWWTMATSLTTFNEAQR